MTREETINQLKEFIILHQEQHGWDVSTIKALEKAIKALEQNAKYRKEAKRWKNKALEQKTCNEKYKEFAEWVAEEIFDDDWKINMRAFFQIACRKLEKVGIVKLIDGQWVLTESEVRNESNL